MTTLHEPTTATRPLYDAYSDEREHLIRTSATLHHLNDQDGPALDAQAALIACATNGTLDTDRPAIRERILGQVADMAAASTHRGSQ